MSSDDSDKTVFQQPMPGGDRTVILPKPGGRGGMQAPRPGAAQVSPQASVPPMQTAPMGNRPPPMQAPQMESGSAQFRTGKGLNRLVNSASILLAVFEKTRGSSQHPDVGGLHKRLINEIRSFEAQLRDQGYKQETILSARYFICTVLDEAVLNTPWGSESAWAQRTLLSVYHNETSGGEKSFLIIDKMREAPMDNLDIIEFFYICLSLGFEGKYRFSTRGRDALDRIKDDLFSIVRRARGEYERTLSSSWQGLGNIKKTLAHYIPTWVIVVLAVAVLFFSYSGFRYWLYQSATPVADNLQIIIDASAASKDLTKP